MSCGRSWSWSWSCSSWKQSKDTLSIYCIRWAKFDFSSRPWVMFYLCYNMHMNKVINMLEWSEGLADWTKHHIQVTHGIRPLVSCRSSDQSAQFGHLSHLDSRYHSRSQKTTSPFSVDWVGKLCFYVGTIQRICLSSDDFYSHSTLISIIAVKQCMAIRARPHVCGVLNVLMFVLTPADGLDCAWFIYSILCWCCCLEKGIAVSLGPNRVRFYLIKETESNFRNVLLNKKGR
jgi:hypothetical protein